MARADRSTEEHRDHRRTTDERCAETITRLGIPAALTIIAAPPSNSSDRTGMSRASSTGPPVRAGRAMGTNSRDNGGEDRQSAESPTPCRIAN